MELSSELTGWLRSERFDMDRYRGHPCVYTLISEHGPVKVGVSTDVFRRVEPWMQSRQDCIERFFKYAAEFQ